MRNISPVVKDDDIEKKKHTHSVSDISDFPDIPDKNTIVDWGFYIKLTSGIPKSDLAADVRASLDKADTALQEHQSLTGYVKSDDGRLTNARPANGGNADTVNGHTVNADVPDDAVFTDTTYEPATSSTDGLMSAEDKVKLDGIAEGANKTIVDTALSGTSENPISNKAVNAALARKAASSHTHDDRYYTKNALDTKLDELTSGNAACVCGIYTGDGVKPRTISLGFTPSAVLISSKDGAMSTPTPGFVGTLAVGDSSGHTYNSSSNAMEAVKIVKGGFQLCASSVNSSNGYTYHYVAFK